MKLSIITINFNNLTGLQKTAESVLNQTWTDYEWIIVDGGSTDGSKEYIEDLTGILSNENNITGTSWNIERFSMSGFTAKDMKEYTSEFSLQDNNGARMLLWCSEPDKGIYNAMNKGIAQASGSYLNFMNSGDCFYDCDTLEKVSAYLNEGNSDVYYGNITIVADDSSLVEQRVYKETLDIFDLLCSNICHQAQYFKTSILKDCCYGEEYKIMGDHAKNIIFLMKDFSFCHLPFYVAKYDNNGVSSKYNETMETERKQIISECFPNSVLAVLLRLYKYENGHIYQRVNKLLDRGGILSLLLRLFLKTFGK